MSDFKVQISELRGAASTFSSLQNQSSQQESLLSSINIGSSDFGCLQGILTLFDAFQNNFDQSKKALSDITESLQKIQRGLEITAAVYELVETQAQEAINKYFGGI